MTELPPITLQIKMHWWFKYLFMPMLPLIICYLEYVGKMNEEKLIDFITKKGLSYKIKR